jgi:hypothetical protein
MPVAAPLIASAAISAGVGAALGVTILGLGLAGSAVLVFGATVALGLVNQALAARVDFSTSATRRTITARQPAAPRRLVVGAARIGGTIVYLGATDSGRKLHVVVALCDGPVTAIEEIWFGDQRIDPGMLGDDGTVLDGRFAGLARIIKHLGAADQVADGRLVAEVAEWTTAHRLQGIAYLYLRLERDDNVFVDGLPAITALVRGPAVLDVRDNTMRWTPNAILATRAWLTDPHFGLGAEAAPNYALDFDGVSDDEVSIGDVHTFSGNNPFTLEAWVRVGTVDGSIKVPGSNIQVAPSVEGYEWPRLTSIGKFEFGRWVAGASVFAVSTSVFTGGERVHIAGVYDGSQLEIFINGISENTEPDARSAPAFTGNLLIGRYSTLRWDDWIDDPRIWNLARTQPEIAANMKRRLAGDEAGLVGYWPMDEGNGAIAADATSNGNDGAITGAAWVVGQTMPSAAGVEPEIDDADTAAAANICDEIVDVAEASDTVVYDAAEDFLIRPGVAADSGHEQIGWPGAPTTNFLPRIRTGPLPAVLSSTGTPPAPLVDGRVYYVRWMTRASCRLAKSAEKAVKRKWIELDDTGSGTHKLTYTTTDKDGELVTKITTVEAVAATASLRRADPAAWGWRRGDRVILATTGTLPAPLSPATDYYAVPNLAGRTALAATLADAVDGVLITLTDAGSGEHTITRTGQVRYTANGEIVAGAAPHDQLAGLISASAGRAVHSGWTYRLFAGAARTVIVDLDEDDLAGPLRIVTKTTRRERFNGVKGVFVSPDNEGQPSDYPPVRSATFAALDGETIDAELDLPFTDSPVAAQRIAKIALLTGRQEIVVEGRWKLKALRLIASDWASLSNARFGWSAKAFEVLEWKFASVGDPPALAIDAVLREVAASDFDWASSEEQAVDPAPNTELPNPFEPAPPTGLQITEETYETTGSAGVKARAVATWAAPDDGFSDRGGRYNLGLRGIGAEIFDIVARPTATGYVLEDLAPGAYEFAVQAVNRLGAQSDWNVTTVELRGLLAPPADLTGLTLQAISAVAIFQWDRHPDLDVRQGGRIRIRHSELFAGALWQTSSEIVDAVPGDSVFATAPLKAGTYLFRVYDSSGVPSDGVVSVSTKAAEHLNFANIDTIVEDPLFVGTHNGTVAPDGVLKLAGLGLFDDIPDFDAVASLDIYGGIAPSGTYDFAGGFDLGTVRTVRLESLSTVLVRNLLDLIDDRAAPVDDWEDWDGTVTAEGDLSVWFRETDDDPAGSPTWSDWRRLTRADVEARGIDLQARLSINDPAYNIEASALAVSVEEVA